MSTSIRTRKGMIEFLSSHFRYNTMNSWNHSSSYAKNIKIHHIQFPNAEIENRAYNLLGVEESFQEFDMILQEFAERHNFNWQIGRNGRSGGYLVLHQGYMKKSEYKRRCQDCGQKNYRADAKECGFCHSKNMEDYHGMETGMYGKSVDQLDNTDFEDWNIEDLKDMVKLVRDFDKTCDKAIKAFINFCKEHKVEPKKIMVAINA